VSNYASKEEAYLAATASYYGSIEQHVERVAIEKGFTTRTGNVSINKLSAHSGVSTATLWYLLRDKKHFRSMNLVTLAKLCHALGVQPGDLMTYVPGGSARGLGYSSDAFAGLMGTASQGRESALPQDSEDGASGGDSERGALDQIR
jgi:DNA-binding Xre family transcriptional regulator